MTKKLSEDTIAAISTPLGMGGIGVVRLSGPQALEIAQRVFRPKKQPKNSFLSHRFYLGEVIHPANQKVIDEVLLVYMRHPHTYTREDVVEIQCHSGLLILREILEAVLQGGARLAEPGEFTKRAFLNGRIDLTQAEAVIDLINAKTQQALELANKQRSGKLAGQIQEFREELLELLTYVEASIDFPEEEIPEISSSELRQRLQNISKQIQQLISSYEEGRIFREGISAVIVGKPNVGKSSLLNALLGEERAIVTSIPGTTRDVIEEFINVQGIPLKILDTAGLRHAQDIIEEAGVRRTKKCLQEADLVIWVLDGSAPASTEDFHILTAIQGKNIVIVINKKDLPQKLSLALLGPELPSSPIISISALYGHGLAELKEAIATTIIKNKLTNSAEVIISNLRHKHALVLAQEALNQAQEGLGQNLSYEFIALDLRQAIEALGEIIGATASEDVLERIFSRFCIGK